MSKKLLYLCIVLLIFVQCVAESGIKIVGKIVGLAEMQFGG